jgi:hypothetical protein
MYDKTFVTLTERFYKGVPWPPVELLAPLVDHDHVFCMLYKVSLRLSDGAFVGSAMISGFSGLLRKFPFELIETLHLG